MHDLIGVVRVPVAGVLCLSDEWRQAFSLPSPSHDDWDGIASLRGSAALLCNRSLRHESSREPSQRDVIASVSHCMRIARSFSFYSFLHDRALSEARAYANAGIRHLVLDFSSPEYVDEQAVYWIARGIAETFRNECNGEFWIGIRIGDDTWAVDIASRLGYDSVFCVDSCNYCNVTLVRNMLTDGTGDKKPRIFTVVYASDLVSADCCIEGIIARETDGEERMNEIGEEVAAMEKSSGIRIPVVGYYRDEIEIDGLRSDMLEWGSRDYMVVDLEVRAHGTRNGAIDLNALEKMCENARNLK